MERAEAIKIIKTATVYTPEEMEALETLIPELKESEDEMIIKTLQEYVKNRNWILNGPSQGEVLTWLEKQKDASKAIKAVDRIDKYIDKHLANAHDMKDSDPDKKYYRGWDDALGKMSEILQDVYSGEKQKEQPQEELVYRLNGFMQEYIKEGKDEAEKEHRFKCYQLFWDALEDADFFEQKEQKPTPDWMPKFLDELRSKKNYFDLDEHRDIEGHILAIINWIAPNYFKEKEQKPVEGDNETEIQKAFREGKSAGRKEVLDHPEVYGLRNAIEEAFEGFEDALTTLLENVYMESNDEDGGEYGIEHFRKIAKEASSYLIPLANNEKPAEWSENFEEAVADLIEKAKQGKCDSLSPTEEGFKLLAIAKHSPVKQEWSDEDEKMACTILNLLCSQVTYVTGQGTISGKQYPTYAKERDWFYALAKKMGFHKYKIGEVITEWKKEDIDDKMLSKSKPIEWTEEDKKKIQEILEPSYETHCGLCRSFCPQQKIEWSEEDEIYLQDVLWCMKQASKVARGENDMGACWSAERWLKSLPERFNLQPK